MNQFKTVKFMTVEQKEKILKLWIRFLKNGFQRQDFTHALYEHLHLHCADIAYNDIHGYFAEYFETGTDKIRFLEKFDIQKMRGNWLREITVTGDYGDINEAMILEAQKYLPVLYAGANAQQKQLDLRVAEQLLARHGLTLTNAVKPVSAQTGNAATGTQVSLF